MVYEHRIAVVSHRGWASSAIVAALAASSAQLKVLYRNGSDISGLPSNVTTSEVNFEDQDTIIEALQDIDIVISLAGHDGVGRQRTIVEAIPKTQVQLFAPSDLAARYDEQGLQIPVNRNKMDIEEAAKAAGIPITIVLPGNFAEFALDTCAMGVDAPRNRMVYTGNSANEVLNVCTRKYVAEAYKSIFTNHAISELKNRIIGLSEVTFTGAELAGALEKKYKGEAPKVFKHSLEYVNAEIEQGLSSGSPFTLAWYCRKIWGNGLQTGMIGTDIWEVPGYVKATLEELIVEGKLGQYREMPSAVHDYFTSKDYSV